MPHAFARRAQSSHSPDSGRFLIHEHESVRFLLHEHKCGRHRTGMLTLAIVLQAASPTSCRARKVFAAMDQLAAAAALLELDNDSAQGGTAAAINATTTSATDTSINM